MGLSLEDRGVQVCLGVAATGVACGVYAYFKHFRVQGKVETESQRHGGELVMKVLKEQGCVASACDRGRTRSESGGRRKRKRERGGGGRKKIERKSFTLFRSFSLPLFLSSLANSL